MHQEKTPSFKLHLEPEPHFHCYGCHFHGDVIDLCQRLESYDTVSDALVSLSMRYGIELPGRPDSWHRKNERQNPVRDAIEDMKVLRLQRCLFKMVEPYVTDAADAENIWRECKPLAQMWLARMQGEATNE